MSDLPIVVVLSPRFPTDFLAQVRAVSPRLRVFALRDLTVVPAAARGAEVLAWWDGSRSALATLRSALPALRWVQSNVAGVGDKRLDEVLGPGVTLTSAAGVYADLVAEHALMLILALYRRLPRLLEQQRLDLWQGSEAGTLAGQTLGIVGAGGIGRATARLARAFGMHVVGLKRTPGEVPELDRTLPYDALPQLLAESDVLLLAAPATPQTRGLIDAAALGQMKPTAFLVNVARGSLVVTDDLVQALQRGRIAGAGLDVTDPEPLPAGHPLWHAPGVIITPHQANPDVHSAGGPVDRFCENLRRYLAGESLLHPVDPEAGY